MGAGASTAGGKQLNGGLGDCGPALSSLSEVFASSEKDRFRVALQRHEDFLFREHKQCRSLNFDSTSRHHQPVLREKLELSLCYLDDVGASFSEDQRRHQGFNKVHHDIWDTGHVRAMCKLNNGASLACASSSGPVWVYNWRRGDVVSRFRGSALCGGPRGRRLDSSIVSLFPIDEDGSMLVTGDELGWLSLWDLAGPELVSEVRLHQGAITGVQGDLYSDSLVTTSEDGYLMVYDLRSQQVLQRAKPGSLEGGNGVPNMALEVAAGNGRSKQICVGGADGKLRMWTRDDRGLQQQCMLPCSASKPTRCLFAADGMRLAVASSPAESVYCGCEPGPGGLQVFDVRKLGGDGRFALLAEHSAADDKVVVRDGAPRGVVDMALVEEGGETLALCLMNGVVATFDLDRLEPGAAGTSDSCAAPADDTTTTAPDSEEGPEVLQQSQISTAFPPAFVVDIEALQFGAGGGAGAPAARQGPSSHPCGILTHGPAIFIASTQPSLNVWRRPDRSERLGHSEYRGAQPPPLALISRCVPHLPEAGGAAAAAAPASTD